MINRNMMAMAWAQKARGISPGAWRVLMTMAMSINSKRPSYDVWPRQSVLAEDCDMPVSTLKRKLDELEKAGFITRSKRFRKSGGFACCTYVLCVRGSLEMPGQDAENYDFAAEDEAEDALAQNEPARSPTDELSRSLTGELAIEPENPEPDTIPSANALAPFQDEEAQDLFGKRLDEPPEPSLTEHIETRWRDLKARHPGIAAVRKIDDGLKHQIEQRAKQHRTSGQTEIDVWNEALDAVDRSEFLQGRAPPGRGRDAPFRLTLAWLSKATNFREVIGGKYDGTRDPALCDPDTGRRLGPTEQALRATVAGFRARQERGFGAGNQGGNLARITG